MHVELEELFYHPVPRWVSWLDFLGFADAFLFVNQAITGLLLATRYRPSVAAAGNLPDAYRSVAEIMSAPAGPLIRGLHFWGANAVVVLVFLHALRVFYIGAYKHPRRATWILGVLLGVVTLLFAFSGYLLPWDQQAYWATTVGTAMSTYAPLIGRWLVELARGGAYISGLTLTRFYALHTIFLPALFWLLLAGHLALVMLHGLAEVEAALPASYRKLHVRGKRNDLPPGFVPFWPPTVFRMALLVFLLGVILVALAATFEPGLGSPADPLNRENYQPVPVWYFLSIYQFLKYLPGRLDAWGIVGIPLVAAVVLLGLPYFDRNPSRRPGQRPLAIGAGLVVVLGMATFTYLGWSSMTPTRGGTAVKEHPGFGADLRPVLQVNCANCHSGRKKSGGLDLGSYASLMKGGNTGPVVKPGDPAGRRLVQALEGTTTDVTPMPLGQQPLPATWIKSIRNWIRDGAPDN